MKTITFLVTLSDDQVGTEDELETKEGFVTAIVDGLKDLYITTHEIREVNEPISLPQR